jgi:hypothetical protein
MTEPKKDHSTMKNKAVHEASELLWLFLYLAFFFCSLAAYSMLLLKEASVTQSLTFGFALINALVIAKVILIGEYAHVGRKFENSSVLATAVIKAFLYSCLVLAFHFLEEGIKGLIHGKELGSAFHEVRIDDLAGRTLIVFCTFVPLFAFREIRSVMGDQEFNALLLKKRTTAVKK